MVMPKPAAYSLFLLVVVLSAAVAAEPRTGVSGDGAITVLADSSVDCANEERTTKTHWLNTASNIRHNSTCRYFRKTKSGRMCEPDEGKACKLCGG